MDTETVQKHFKGVKELPTRAGFSANLMALCPAHDDHRASLSIDISADGTTLLCCQS
ncbi:unnamed protein product, partial [marine sediment metagenome]